ncbi:MAG: type II and III secretion system protein [Gemmataceae bacterium]|nr:type II and III secretion system protein [Gemmataceae bacterium]
MPIRYAAALLALMLGSQVRAGEPKIELDVLIARLRPDAWAALQGPLSRSVVKVQMKDVWKDALAGVIPPEQGNLVAILQQLETKGMAKLLAQPRLVTKSGQPCTFLDGGEAAIPVPAGLGKVGVQFEEIGTRLNFLPLLAAGGVSLELDCEVSSPTRWVEELGCTLSKRDQHRVPVTALVKTGHRLVVAGLVEKKSIDDQHAILGLSALPLVGDAFRWESKREVEHRLLILVTPRVVKPEQE